MSNRPTGTDEPPPETNLPPLEPQIEIDIHVEPVRHKSNKKYRDFVHALRAAIAPQAWQKFIGEVQVQWTLYQDERLRYDTDKIADLDNLVKGLNDAIKGPHGILVDDSQIQSLNVSWLPRFSDSEPHIRLRVDGGPGMLAMREPIRFYEMSDGRFYPLQAYPIGSDLEHVLADTYDTLLQRNKEMGSMIHGNSATPEENFRFRQQFGPISSGFMKTRVADSGFELVAYEAWRHRVPPRSPNSRTHVNPAR
ncbi:RusA family crossover junction endodeoxyribonuclease [Dietzia maris]|uniref:RusA family crossover junction endodeoxyribonuclease n=1 Tax=Dietzia maris TaxID=37915 RepID=UPI0030023033